MSGKAVLKSDLPSEGQALVKEMQRINFGRIQHLPVRDGLPVWDARTRIIRKVKLGAENSPHSYSALGDFELKRKVVELFDQLRHIGDGLILSLNVKHGLPFAMDVEDSAGSGFLARELPPNSPAPSPHIYACDGQCNREEELAAM